MAIGQFRRVLGEVVLVLGEAGDLCFGYLGALFGKPAARILLASVAIWSLFVIFPEIDLAVAGLFAAETGGFPLSADTRLQSLRGISSFLTLVLIAGALAVVAAAALLGLRIWLGLRPCQALFILAVYLCGPGLIVNGILKSHYGRARSRDVQDFCGGAQFTPVWQISEECARNCSFTSGEAASAAAMLAVVVVVSPAWRTVLLLVLAPLAVLFSVGRIMFGAHFLSDVLLSWVIVALLTAVLARFMLTSNRMAAVDLALAGVLQKKNLRWLTGPGRTGS